MPYSKKYIIPSYKSFLKLVSSSDIMESKYYHVFCTGYDKRFVFYPKEYLSMYEQDSSVKLKLPKDSLEAKCSRCGIISVPYDCFKILDDEGFNSTLSETIHKVFKDTNLPPIDAKSTLLMFFAGLYVVKECIKPNSSGCRCAFTMTSIESIRTPENIYGISFKTHFAY